VLGHINFDGCSGYAKEGYTGHAIMDAMDCLPANPEDREPVEQSDTSDDWFDLPEEPEIRIHSLECIKIDSGDETVQMMIELAIQDPKVPFAKSDFSDPDSQATQYMIDAVRQMRKKEAEALDEKSIVLQWSNAVDGAVSVIAGNVMRLAAKNGLRVDKSMAGDIRRRINTAKKNQCGPVERDIDVLKRHYQWLKELESNIKKTSEIPVWLA
jgi:hypothetical protein